MYTAFLLIHVIIAIALVTLVLLQQGRGAEAGAAFGSGASSTVFGSRGSSSFLSRVTAFLATGFFVTSLLLAYFVTQGTTPTSLIESATPPAPAAEQPAAGAETTAPEPVTSPSNESTESSAPAASNTDTGASTTGAAVGNSETAAPTTGNSTAGAATTESPSPTTPAATESTTTEQGQSNN